MPVANERSEALTAIRSDLGAIFVSLELSQSKWLITSLSPEGGGKMSKHAAAARTNRHSTQPDDCGNQAYEAFEVDCSTVVSGGETSEVLHLVEASLDAVAVFVGGFIVRNDDFA